MKDTRRPKDLRQGWSVKHRTTLGTARVLNFAYTVQACAKSPMATLLLNLHSVA